MDHNSSLLTNAGQVLVAEGHEKFFRRVGFFVSESSPFADVGAVDECRPREVHVCRADAGEFLVVGGNADIHSIADSFVAGSDRMGLRRAQTAWPPCEPIRR